MLGKRSLILFLYLVNETSHITTSTAVNGLHLPHICDCIGCDCCGEEVLLLLLDNHASLTVLLNSINFKRYPDHTSVGYNNGGIFLNINKWSTIEIFRAF